MFFAQQLGGFYAILNNTEPFYPLYIRNKRNIRSLLVLAYGKL
jgi:hypothetical protein